MYCIALFYGLNYFHSLKYSHLKVNKNSVIYEIYTYSISSENNEFVIVTR